MDYVGQVIMLYTLNFYRAVCQLYLNKTGRKIDVFLKRLFWVQVMKGRDIGQANPSLLQQEKQREVNVQGASRAQLRQMCLGKGWGPMGRELGCHSGFGPNQLCHLGLVLQPPWTLAFLSVEWFWLCFLVRMFWNGFSFSIWVCLCVCMCVCAHACIKLPQSCPTLCNLMDCGQPGFLVHGISQARILDWVAISSSRGSSQPRVKRASLMSPALAGRFLTTSTTWEAPV